MTTATKSASKYTPAMEAAIVAAPVLNAAVAAELAASFGPTFTARGVIAKINRMPAQAERYANKPKTTKSGGTVEQKEAVVAEIAKLTGLSLAGLEKAPKPVLQALRDFVAAA